MILLLDCSKGLKLIVGNKQRIITKVNKPKLKKVSERLILEIEKLLTSIGKEYKHLSKIIVINGPGSFTGIRTALTASKVLGLSLNIPVYGISLFDLLLINYKKNKFKKNVKLLIQFNRLNFFTQKVIRSGKKSEIYLEKLTNQLFEKNKDCIFIFLDDISVDLSTRKSMKLNNIIIYKDIISKCYRGLSQLSEKKYIPKPIYVKTFQS